MSQFLICKQNKEINWKEKVELIYFPFKTLFLNDVCNFFWGNKTSSVFMINIRAMDIDELFIQAQKDLTLRKKIFYDTELYNLLSTLLIFCDEIIAWYSDYYTDLPVVNDSQELFKLISKQLTAPMCEVYFRYIKI